MTGNSKRTCSPADGDRHGLGPPGPQSVRGFGEGARPPGVRVQGQRSLEPRPALAARAGMKQASLPCLWAPGSLRSRPCPVQAESVSARRRRCGLDKTIWLRRGSTVDSRVSGNLG